MGTFEIILLLVCCVFVISVIISSIIRKKSGKSACGFHCSSCAGCPNCHPQKEINK